MYFKAATADCEAVRHFKKPGCPPRWASADFLLKTRLDTQLPPQSRCAIYSVSCKPLKKCVCREQLWQVGWFGEQFRELAAQDSLWNLMCVFSSVRRQKDKERKSRLSLFLTKSGSHENVSPNKKTNTTPSKWGKNPFISYRGDAAFDKRYSFLTSVSSTLCDSLHTCINRRLMRIQNLYSFFCCIIREELTASLIFYLFFIFFCSISPEAALQWSDSFEELLKRSGQFKAPRISGGCVKSPSKTVPSAVKQRCSIWIVNRWGLLRAINS